MKYEVLGTSVIVLFKMVLLKSIPIHILYSHEFYIFNCTNYLVIGGVVVVFSSFSPFCALVLLIGRPSFLRASPCYEFRQVVSLLVVGVSSWRVSYAVIYVWPDGLRHFWRLAGTFSPWKEFHSGIVIFLSDQTTNRFTEEYCDVCVSVQTIRQRFVENIVPCFLMAVVVWDYI